MIEVAEEMHALFQPQFHHQFRQRAAIRPGAHQRQMGVGQEGEGADHKFLPLSRDQRAHRGQQFFTHAK